MSLLDSTPMGDRDQFSRMPVYAALVLAVLLVVAVLIGARVVFDRAGDQPVALPELPQPDAESPDCAGLMESLPDSLGRFDRSELAEPAPTSAAAWSKNSTERITLRCGTQTPAQWVEGAPTETTEGVTWLAIDDPGTGLTTWYTVDRAVTVAVTAPEEDPTDQLAPAVAELPEEHIAPRPLPLGETPTPHAAGCSGMLEGLPKEIGSYTLDEAEASRAVWRFGGAMPITLACGVDLPESYQPGAQVTKIDDVNWFYDDGVSYALGLDQVVAVFAPPEAAEQALVGIGKAIG